MRCKQWIFDMDGTLTDSMTVVWQGAPLELLRRYGVTTDEAMAFGDSENDVTMLRAVGTGVAMGNAADDVKAAANYVTDDAMQDGIATALRHFELI